LGPQTDYTVPHYTRFLILATLGVAIYSPAQQQPGAVASPTQATQAATDAAQTPSPSTQSAKTPQEIEREIEKKEQSQRALGIVPLFGVTDRQDAPPLTSRGKFDLMAKSLKDPFLYGIAFVQAGIEQANNAFDGYGQGASGYAKRYAAYLADSADSNFWSNFAYPVLFKQDPRYFRLGSGSAKRRLWYALEQQFVARQDSGGKNFHWSNVLGAFTSGTISNIYYPAEDRGVGLTANRAAVSLAYGALGNIGIEFWPDIDRKLFHKKQPSVAPPGSPGIPPK
jgi:hypothetical protein